MSDAPMTLLPAVGPAAVPPVATGVPGTPGTFGTFLAVALAGLRGPVPQPAGEATGEAAEPNAAPEAAADEGAVVAANDAQATEPTALPVDDVASAACGDDAAIDKSDDDDPDDPADAAPPLAIAAPLVLPIPVAAQLIGQRAEPIVDAVSDLRQPASNVDQQPLPTRPTAATSNPSDRPVTNAPTAPVAPVVTAAPPAPAPAITDDRPATDDSTDRPAGADRAPAAERMLATTNLQAQNVERPAAPHLATAAERPVASAGSSTIAASDSVRYLRELGPSRAVQRLAVDLDGSTVAVRIDQHGGHSNVQVHVVDDPSGRLDAGWTTAVERTLNQSGDGGSRFGNGTPDGQGRQRPPTERDDQPAQPVRQRWADALTSTLEVQR